jgi:hypothetical protein
MPRHIDTLDFKSESWWPSTTDAEFRDAAAAAGYPLSRFPIGPVSTGEPDTVEVQVQPRIRCEHWPVRRFVEYPNLCVHSEGGKS